MPFYFDSAYDFTDLIPDEYLGLSAPTEKLADFPDIPFGSVAINTHNPKTNWPDHVVFAGRRNRVLSALSRFKYERKNDVDHFIHWFSDTWMGPDGCFVFDSDHRMTFREVFTELNGESLAAKGMRAYLSQLNYRRSRHTDRKLAAIPDAVESSDPDLHAALHDLALMVRRDLIDAIDAANSNGWYPGVDEGIEPVSDDHVDLVIWGTQRESNRELRSGPDGKLLPAYPLATLPRPIQRAFAERRRLRFQSWGLTRKNWEDNEWSIFNVPDDDFLPPWVQKAA